MTVRKLPTLMMVTLAAKRALDPQWTLLTVFLIEFVGCGRLASPLMMIVDVRPVRPPVFPDHPIDENGHRLRPLQPLRIVRTVQWTSDDDVKHPLKKKLDARRQEVLEAVAWPIRIIHVDDDGVMLMTPRDDVTVRMRDVMIPRDDVTTRLDAKRPRDTIQDTTMGTMFLQVRKGRRPANFVNYACLHAKHLPPVQLQIALTKCLLKSGRTLFTQQPISCWTTPRWRRNRTIRT
jgi:hypothetical protein